MWMMILNLAQAQSRISVPLAVCFCSFEETMSAMVLQKRVFLHTQRLLNWQIKTIINTQIHFHKSVANRRVVDGVGSVDQLPSH